MRRRADIPTRSEVTEKIEKHQEDMTEKLDQLDTVAADTETVRETLENLDFEGTAEGMDEVEQAMEQTENVTIEVFEQRDEDLEETQEQTQEHENELQDRVDTSESDMDKIADAAARTETRETIDELAKAKASVSNDIEFLNEQDEVSRRAREENERFQQAQRDRVYRQGRQ